MSDNTLAWALIFALWVCALALAEPLAIGLRNYRAYHSLERLASFVDAIVGKRLTYARLIAKVPA